MKALQGTKAFQYLEEPEEGQNNKERITFSFKGLNAFVFALISIF